MSDADVQVIEPDPVFVRRVMEMGGATLKKCFQCGNCSVVCEISPDHVPFPRKEMIWAQWGLKDRLLGNADVWLCHQCNDCSTHCPRGAKPGDVMAAVRDISFAEYGAFGLGRFFTGAKYLPALFLIPAVIIAAAIGIASKEGFTSMRPIVYSNMMPVPAIDAVFLPTVGFAALCAIISIMKLWKAMSAGSPGASGSRGSVAAGAIAALAGILKHDKLSKCVTNRPRFTAHLLTMYGFLALLATTTAVAIMYWMNKLHIAEVASTPLSLSHPVKILGNLGAILAVTGVTLIAARRFGPSSEDAGVTGFYDRNFIWILYITIITGVLAEIFRLAGAALLSFGVYYVHLVFVFSLLVYAPFSKFAHFFYRFVALTYAKTVERERERKAS
ncbi:MAG: quinone-interacting membrane-bound oxidoreductase complex subunit QmoC [Candidatus Nitrospinota bacterium M3_3B_026]